MALRRIAAQPSEREPRAGQLLDEYLAASRAPHGPWFPELPGSEEERIERSELQASAWFDAAPQPAAVVLWDLVPALGRRIRLYLASDRRTPVVLGRLLDALEEESVRDGPIASVSDPFPGSTTESPAEWATSTYTERGYFRVERLALRLPPEAPLPDEMASGRLELRTLDAGDEDALAELMRSAYDPQVGTTAPWLVYRDPLRDVRDAVREILQGRRGRWLPWASFGVDVSGALRGASLVVESEFPVVSDVMVGPELRGIGLGTQLAIESSRVLRERASRPPHVVVAAYDLRALRLFRRLGFVPSDRPAAGLWVSARAGGLGLPLRH